MLVKLDSGTVSPRLETLDGAFECTGDCGPCANEYGLCANIGLRGQVEVFGDGLHRCRTQVQDNQWDIG